MKDLIKYGGNFDADNLLEKIENLNNKMSNPDFWNNIEEANKVTEKLNAYREITKPLESLKEDINEINDYIELLNSTYDEEIEKELLENYNNVLIKLDEQEIYTYLNGKYDKENVIFEVHAGAGGTESCDWALMLSRMYTKYFENKNYKYEVIAQTLGEETGIKSITYLVKGNFAYGYLKGEKGVHRLVRLSPFDSNNRRHTSFAAVDVTPEFSNDIDIVINESDLKIDVYRSSGAGGQGVNTTDSAVRVTHLPTKIVVTCQNERSQIKNKEIAIKILKSKLYQLKEKENKDMIDSMKEDHNEIMFGSQIRSYVLHPYSMIKDHRTNYETSNVNKVLDGNLDMFIDSYLKREV